VNRLGADSLEPSHRFLNVAGLHLLQDGEAQLSKSFADPSKDLTDAAGLLFCQSARSNRSNEGALSCREKIPPPGESTFQPFVGTVSISIVGVLRENGLDEDIERIGLLLPWGDAVTLFEKTGNLPYLSSQLS